jgi:hypothetical protein
MFRLWGKIFTDNHLMRDEVVEDETDDTRTHKVMHALTRLCRDFDLAEPIWLNANVSEFRKRAKTRFRQENFVEEIDFDYLEIHVIEE